MATIEETYRTQTPRTAYREVRVGGALLDHVISVDYGFGMQSVPTATVKYRGAPPPGVRFFADVRIETGFNGIPQRRFTGKVQHVNQDGPDTIIECMGTSAALDVPYHRVVKTFTNILQKDALEDLLDDAGILQYQVDVDNALGAASPWTIGTVLNPTLAFQTYGEAVSKVAEVGGHGWYEFPTGTIRVARIDPIPSITASREIFSMRLTGPVAAYPTGITQTYLGAPTLPHMRSTRAEQQIREVKNQVFVRGGVLDVVQSDGATTPLDIAADTKAPSPWVLNPDGSQAYNDYIFTHELIDTVAVAATESVRLTTVLNRLTYRTTIEVDYDPTIVLGQTIRIEDPDYTRLSGNWIVVAYQGHIDEDDASTTITCIGGVEAGGTPNTSPFAFFVYNIEREVIGTKEYALVTLNALLSVDFDGTIASYQWSDNQAPNIATGTTPVYTVRVDPTTLVAPWVVTLTVTDNLGATGPLSIPINIDLGAADVFVPGLFVAFGTHFSASPDGGQTWNDQAAPVGDTVESVGANPRGGDIPGGAVYGTALGALYQTTDFCVTAPTVALAAVGSRFAHLQGDRNNIHHMWSVTEDGRLYWSQADGDAGTWNLYEALRTKLALPALRINRIALPMASGGPTGGVWAFGGEGNGLPLIAIDPARDHGWVKAALGGELSADLPRGGAGSYQIKTGTYTGNGTSKSIAGIGFQPDLIIVAGALANEETMIRAAGMTNTYELAGGGATAQGITSFDADGFTIGTSTKLNANASTYYYVAVKAGITLKAGSYVGDGTASHPISAVGFQPAAVFLFGGANHLLKTSSMGTKHCQFSGTTVEAFITAHDLLSLDVDGFTVEHFNGTSNTPATTYEYIALKADSSLLLGSYVGDGVDNRDILTGTFPFALIAGDLAQEKVHRVDTMPADSTKQIVVAAGALVANRIQSSSNCQVGTDAEVNQAAATYHHLLFAGAGVGGDATLYIYEAASVEQGELAIILNSAAHVPAVYYTADIHGDGSAWRRGTGMPNKSRGRYIGADLEQGKFVFMFDDTAIYQAAVAGDTLAATLAAGVLQAGDAPNHGVFIGAFIGGIANSYIFAAEGSVDGTLWKTWDRGATVAKLRPATGFPAALAGMNAEQIAIGDGAAVVAIDLVVQMDGGSQEILRAHGAAAWAVKSTDTLAENWHLKNLNDVLYRIADKLTTTDIGGPGDLERSTDNGATWAIVIAKDTPNTRGVQSVTIGPDGTLWALYGSHTDTSASLIVYKSIDNGVTWNPAYTDGGSVLSALLPVDIACHPTNPNIIAVTCIRNSGGPRLVITTDAYATAPAIRTMGGSGAGTNGLWLTFADPLFRPDRIVVAGPSGIIQTTDDNGLAWTTRDDPAPTTVGFLVRFGSRLLYSLVQTASDGGSLRISLDAGTTWAEYVTGASIDSGLVAAAAIPYGIALDQEGGLCVMWPLTIITDNWWRNRDPWAAVLPAWESIAFNGDALSTGSCSRQGLAAGRDTQ